MTNKLPDLSDKDNGFSNRISCTVFHQTTHSSVNLLRVNFTSSYINMKIQ